MSFWDDARARYQDGKRAVDKAARKAKELSDAAAPHLDRLAAGAGDVSGAAPMPRSQQAIYYQPPGRPTDPDEAALYDEAMEERRRQQRPDRPMPQGAVPVQATPPPDPFSMAGFGMGMMGGGPDISGILSVRPMEPPDFMRPYARPRPPARAATQPAAAKKTKTGKKTKTKAGKKKRK